MKQPNNNIVTMDQLSDITGYIHSSSIEDVLKKQGVRYFYGKKGVIWTTVGLINAAGGLDNSQKKEEKNVNDII